MFKELYRIAWYELEYCSKNMSCHFIDEAHICYIFVLFLVCVTISHEFDKFEM